MAVKLAPAEDERMVKERFLTQMTMSKGAIPLKVLTKK